MLIPTLEKNLTSLTQLLRERREMTVAEIKQALDINLGRTMLLLGIMHSKTGLAKGERLGSYCLLEEKNAQLKLDDPSSSFQKSIISLIGKSGIASEFWLQQKFDGRVKEVNFCLGWLLAEGKVALTENYHWKIRS